MDDALKIGSLAFTIVGGFTAAFALAVTDPMISHVLIAITTGCATAAASCQTPPWLKVVPPAAAPIQPHAPPG